MHRIPVPLIRRDESHDAHPAENTAWAAAPMTWACRTPEAARVVAAVFAGDYAASPRAARRFVPWSARAREIRAAVDEQPTLPGMARVASGGRVVASYAERTARKRAPLAARVGRYQ